MAPTLCFLASLSGLTTLLAPVAVGEASAGNSFYPFVGRTSVAFSNHDHVGRTGGCSAEVHACPTATGLGTYSKVDADYRDHECVKKWVGKGGNTIDCRYTGARLILRSTRRDSRSSGWLGLRGGSTITSNVAMDGDDVADEIDIPPRDIKVIVATTKISTYVDARGEVTARSDWTVARLREELEQKFPGKIPASIQRLFKGTQLLADGMTLEEASEGAEGPLSLLLDNAPPIDASRFDPDTAVPSRKDGQVEAFSACLAAQACLQETLLGVMRGKTEQDDPELSRSVSMKADFENVKSMLERSFLEVPEPSAADEGESYGILHEALRPLARSLDVDWVQSAQHALFAYICAQFGARGNLRRIMTLMLIPLMFLAQTRSARVAVKLARNLAAEIPVLRQLFLGVFQAPGQVILTLDENAYVRDLYGPGGPKFDPAFVEDDEGEGTREDSEEHEEEGDDGGEDDEDDGDDDDGGDDDDHDDGDVDDEL